MEDVVKAPEYDSLAFAYIGDAVWELELRKAVAQRKEKHVKLVTDVKKYVNAKFQSGLYIEISEKLSEYELSFARRARNCAIKSYPKSCTPIEYRNATAFEALMGYYHLTGQNWKVEELIKKYIIKGEE